MDDQRFLILVLMREECCDRGHADLEIGQSENTCWICEISELARHAWHTAIRGESGRWETMS